MPPPTTVDPCEAPTATVYVSTVISQAQISEYHDTEYPAPSFQNQDFKLGNS